jgi:hypothetical protein
MLQSKMDWNKVYRGEIDGIPVIIKFKGIMRELLKGYPAFEYFGIFESHFGNKLGKDIVKILEDDKLITVDRKGTQTSYRLSKDGIDVAVSLVNLDYSEKMHQFTIAIIVLTVLTLVAALFPNMGSNFVQWLMSHRIVA